MSGRNDVANRVFALNPGILAQDCRLGSATSGSGMGPGIWAEDRHIRHGPRGFGSRSPSWLDYFLAQACSLCLDKVAEFEKCALDARWRSADVAGASGVLESVSGPILVRFVMGMAAPWRPSQRQATGVPQHEHELERRPSQAAGSRQGDRLRRLSERCHV